MDFGIVPIAILRVLDEDLEGREARPLFLVEVEWDYCFVSGSGRGKSGGRWLVGIVIGPS